MNTLLSALRRRPSGPRLGYGPPLPLLAFDAAPDADPIRDLLLFLREKLPPADLTAGENLVARLIESLSGESFTDGRVRHDAPGAMDGRPRVRARDAFVARFGPNANRLRTAY